MTDPRDPHDDAVDAAWRAQARDVPPAALDAAILAAAHRAVQSAPRAAGAPPRWRAFAPLAVAATLGAIAFGVLQLAPRDETPERITSDAPVASLRKSVTPHAEAPAREPASQSPAPVASAPAPDASAAAPQASTVPAAPKAVAPAQAPPVSVARDLERQREAPARASAAPDRGAEKKDEGSLPEPFPAAAPRMQRAAPAIAQPPAAALSARPGAGALQPASPPMSSSDRPAAAQPAVPPLGPLGAPQEAQDADARTLDRPPPASKTLVRRDAADALTAATRNEVAAAPPRAGAAAGAAAPRAKLASARSPDAFIGDLRRLRAAGEEPEAMRTLGAFRAAYADADERLPEDLRAWARGVPR